MRDISKEELKDIISKHSEWLLDKDKGERADLSYADLRFADLRSANLRYADLRSANLRYAGLRSADLRFADLRSANLDSADLRYADLRYADLRSANLRYADLRSADLDNNYISISRIGSSKRMTTYSFSEDKIWCGCFTGNLKEFKDNVLKDYPDKDNIHHIEYIEFIKYLKKLKKAYKEVSK